ncbi:SpoIIIAH-like family protein [Paenibacillus wynnii]|uniref:Mutants block sporulation after engulfment (Stage III sporulation) n=1 Tax=Paenibacillus wynnii TaxID=268407 RepID=A0A098M5Y2_9BACL|nr:SpoIIIAH-like family protein [Paenibacillus wynnii]KGE17970.1 hypothetical protein PWYN_25850 [Paenibacillus wynnii]
MNGKRQTIWLVSMLSLMVVLSAYYLFTEDSGVSAPTETAGTMQVEGKVKDAGGSTLPSVGDGGVVINEVVKDGNVVTDPDTAADSGAVATDTSTDTATNSSKDDVVTDTAVKDPLASEQAAATSETTKDPVKDTAVKDKDASASADKPVVKDDAAILDEVASQSVSASSMFTNYLYEREQKNLKDQNDLLALINDMDKTPADNAMASEQLRNLEEKESKITGIEEKLQLKYGEAIVKEEKDDTYKVVVLSDKLDVKQAVGIIDLVMKELSVTQDKISVQYVSE